MSGNRTIYFKRVVRGLNFDEIVISPNSVLCGTPSSETDYEFTTLDPPDLLYRANGNDLLLFVHNDAAVAPTSGRFPVNVIQKSLDTPEYEQLERDAQKLGLVPLHIELDGKLKCRDRGLW
jgi:hypothetical protein